MESKTFIMEPVTGTETGMWKVVDELSMDFVSNVRQRLGGNVSGAVYIVVNGKSHVVNLDLPHMETTNPFLHVRPVDNQEVQKPSLILPNYSEPLRLHDSLGGVIDRINGESSYPRTVNRKFEMDFNGADARFRNGNVGNFIIFFRKICQDPDVRQTTRNNYMYTYDKLLEFASLADFSDVNFDFLKKFEFYLTEHCHCNSNTVGKHVKVLRKAVNQAIKLGYIDIRNNPFFEYSVRMNKSEKEVLSMNDLALIDSYFHHQFDNLPERDREILGAFLFSCYTGLRFSDLRHVTRKHIVKRRSKHWLEIETQKTGKIVKIPLDDIFRGRGMEIVQRFNRKNGKLFVIPINAICNRRIKAILKQVHKRIRYKRISFHTARRTMATLLLALRVPITTVQTLLGHSSVKTTEVYAKVKEQTVYNDIKKCRNKSLDKIYKRSETLIRRRNKSE